VRSTARSGALASFLLLSLAALVPCRLRAAPAAAAPEPLTASVSLEPAEIRVGDAARLTVAIDHPAAGRIGLPEFGQGKAVVVIDRKQETAPTGSGGRDGRERTTVAVLLTSFEIGEHRIGAGKIAFTGGGGTSLEIIFPAATLRTKSLLRGENTPLRGIKGLARWPAPLLLWFGCAAGLAALAAVIVLGVRLRRTGRATGPAPAPRPAPPHEVALKALAALRGAKPLGEIEVESFYRELSTIARRYVEERFGLRAPERTTEEFIREAAGSGLLELRHQELVRAFLEQCDLVKFARLRPLPEDATLAFESAVRLVRETRPPAREAAGP
jgi:hypothetical protein